MKSVTRKVLASLALWAVWGCAETPSPTSGPDGPTVSVNVAALNLQGVGDVVWDVQVVNGRTPTPDVVWQRRISSTGYGDGAGSASYVGPCDADAAVSENEVRVWVVGVYSGAVSALGSFDSGQANGVAGPSVSFENPTSLTSPLTQTVPCEQNADRPVRFDVALMRPAQQGFFDIAVNFNNIFCSAKFDCCQETEPGTCGSDIALLFDAGGQRASTMVLGFACTAGARADAETELYLDALALDCTSPTTFGAGFSSDIVIDPSGPAGNQCTAGDVEGCSPRVTSPTANANAYLYQVGVYRGLEQLESGGVLAQKVYWNVALGVVRKDGGVGIEDCWLRTKGTADDALGTGVVDNGVVAQGAVYPYVQWEVKLDASCHAEELSFGAAGAMVRTAYTQTGAGAATVFAYGYGRNMGPGSFCASPCGHGTCAGGTCVCEAGYVVSGGVCVVPCGLLEQACPAGFTCNTELAAGSSYTAFCVSDGTVPAFGTGAEMVYVPGKATGETVPKPRWTFWMGCNSLTQGGTDANCSATNGAEAAPHEVTLSPYAMDRTYVTAAAYKVCATTSGSGCTLPSETNTTYATYASPTKQSHPINYLNWSQASAYCAWKGKRLCTEAEWERGARGGCETLPTGNCQTAMRKYPWGNTAATCEQAVFATSSGFCEPVTYTGSAVARTAGASPYGALNLSGNLWEFTSDYWSSTFAAEAVTNPQGPASGSNRVMRGGAFGSDAAGVRAGNRNQVAPSLQYSSGGFRCCRSYP